MTHFHSSPLRLIISLLVALFLAACSSTLPPLATPEPKPSNGFTFHFDPATGFSSGDKAETEIGSQALLTPGVHLKLARLQHKKISASEMELRLSFKNLAASALSTLLLEAQVSSGTVQVGDPYILASDSSADGLLSSNETTNEVVFTLLSPDNFTSAFTVIVLAYDDNLFRVASPQVDFVGATRVIGSNLYFVADSAAYGLELWKSDGSEAGTSLVKDIRTGVSGANPNGLTEFGGSLYFAATDASGMELWKSDGTEAGTVMVKDINPGLGSSAPGRFTLVNGTLYFFASDGVNGTELWKSDGTTSGTTLVKDINPGTGGSVSGSLSRVAIGNTLYFSATTPASGLELWKSDGTTSGTVLVRDINPGTANSNPQNLTHVNGTLFFSAQTPTDGNELWKSDGTEAGTTLVKDIGPGSSDGINTTTWLPKFTAVGSTLYFMASPFVTYGGGEIWKSDGTEAGTALVKDLEPENDLDPTNLTSFNNHLFFTGFVPGYSYELWKTDGSEAGTVIVKDTVPGLGDSLFSRLLVANGSLYFSAARYTASSEFIDYGIWKSDGSDAGTTMIKTLPFDFDIDDDEPAPLIDVSGTVFFFESNTATLQLWKVLE
jgi:ELWxxDGT repeat protein